MTDDNSSQPQRRSTRANLLAGLLLLITTAAAAFLVRYETPLAITVVVALLVALVVTRGGKPDRLTRATTITMVAAVLGHLAALMSPWQGVWALAVTLSFAAAALLLVRAGRVLFLRTRRLSPLARLGARSGLVLAGTLATVTALTLTVVTTYPAPLASVLQSAAGVRQSFEPAGPEGLSTDLPNGVTRTSDVAYANEYPNSFLDIYTREGDSQDRPTYVYVHGGGWVGGGKADGDPFAADGNSFAPTYLPAIEAGYNVVSVGYAFAPEYTYPTPLLQLSDAMTFLQENGQDYGIDMDKVVVGGGSAGGQITGQFANIQTNPAYAREVGIDPVMTDNLAAVALDSAALDFDRMGLTSEVPVLHLDIAYGLCARLYLQDDRAAYAEANVTDHVTKDYPPTFISDGNTGTFSDQSEDLHKRLDDLGVPNALYIPSLEDGTVTHGFMIKPSRWTNEYNTLKYEFLTKVMG